MEFTKPQKAFDELNCFLQMERINRIADIHALKCYVADFSICNISHSGGGLQHEDKWESRGRINTCVITPLILIAVLNKALASGKRVLYVFHSRNLLSMEPWSAAKKKALSLCGGATSSCPGS